MVATIDQWDNFAVLVGGASAALAGLRFHAPGADITLAADLHADKVVRIGRINAQGQFDVVFEAHVGQAF